jgi:hypothetical protein
MIKISVFSKITDFWACEKFLGGVVHVAQAF